MEMGLLLSILYLVRDIIFSPKSVFENIKKGIFLKEVCIVFCIGAFITFSKTLLIKKQTITFFANEKLNEMLSLLSIPQVRWIMLYVGYFMLLFCIFVMCRFFNKQAKLKFLILSLMSISGIGIILQISFYAFRFIVPKELIHISSYLIYFWVIILSFWAIKITQSVSFSKAVICFLLPTLPFTFFLGLVVISPYLAWLNI